LTDSNYVNVLVQLPEGAFKTNDKLNKTFSEVKDEAFEGSDYKDSGKNSGKDKANTVNSIISTSIIAIIFLVFISVIIKAVIKRIKHSLLKRSMKGEYYREVPYEGDITIPYYMLKQMNETNFSKVFAAYLLKWIYDERIDIKTVKKKFIFTKEEQVIHILKANFPKIDYFEVGFFDIILSAAEGKDQLSQTELGKYLKTHTYIIEKFEKEMEDHSKDVLADEEYIEPKLNQSFLVVKHNTQIPKKEQHLKRMFISFNTI